MKKLIPYAIIVALIITGILTVQYFLNKIDTLKQDVNNQKNLTSALTDTISTYKNKHGKLVSQKRTLQITIKDLERQNVKLSDSKAELLKHVKELQEDNNVINSAYIETKTRLDSLLNTLPQIYPDINRVVFTDSTNYLNYRITIGNVLPYESKVPYMKFNKFTIPNKINVDFVWGEKSEGYPMSVKVTNSNKYVQTIGIESYAIPELKPDKNGWQKTWDWIKGKGDMLIGIGIGYGAGQIMN